MSPARPCSEHSQARRINRRIVCASNAVITAGKNVAGSARSHSGLPVELKQTLPSGAATDVYAPFNTTTELRFSSELLLHFKTIKIILPFSNQALKFFRMGRENTTCRNQLQHIQDVLKSILSASASITKGFRKSLRMERSASTVSLSFPNPGPIPITLYLSSS